MTDREPDRSDRPSGAACAEPPLCVDLDGTLLLSDVLWESVARRLGDPLGLLRALWALRGGKQALKGALARDTSLDPSLLPYREDLLEHLRAERERGRRVVLATATHRSVADGIAAHLGVFDEVVATDAATNLGGRRKAERLVAMFGEGGFDYVGDHRKDVPVFEVCRQALLADPSDTLRRTVERRSPAERVFERERSGPHVVVRALRVHQWTKNLLLFVPLVMAQRIADGGAWVSVLLAFACFSVLASATYLINDLRDLDSDRRHEKKRHRPLASGALSIPAGLGIVATLSTTAFVVAALTLPPVFVAWMVAYTCLTLWYSFDLKRRVLVDVLTLAALYTVRILAGGAAIGVVVSEWLLMFSLFFFVSLAFLKRAIELAGKSDDELLAGRGYRQRDLAVITPAGVVSGLLSVLVLALYVNSPFVYGHYADPRVLWLLCPLDIYWITRMWFLAVREHVHHDPILFAATDRRTYAVAVVAALILLAAKYDLVSRLALG